MWANSPSSDNPSNPPASSPSTSRSTASMAESRATNKDASRKARKEKNDLMKKQHICSQEVCVYADALLDLNRQLVEQMQQLHGENQHLRLQLQTAQRHQLHFPNHSAPSFVHQHSSNIPNGQTT